MPWSAKDASKHTKKADTPAEKKQWAKTANSVLKSSKNEGKAVRIANSAIAKGNNKKRGK
jgi:uncharacterized protein YdaT